MPTMFAVVDTVAPDIHLHVFNVGDTAATLAKELTQQAKATTNTKYRVIRFDDGDKVYWTEREQARFDSGEYKKLPEGFPSLPEHYAHVSQDNSAQIAFTPDDIYGEGNRQLRMRPGRYIERHWTKLRDKFGYFSQIEMISLYLSENVVDVVLFATTPDEIEEVYVNGPGSCMSHEYHHYDSSCHPVRVYGAGDLAIAYIEEKYTNNDEIDDDANDGHIVARCLCWPERKTYGRIYGDMRRLIKALELLGYDNDGNFDGAKLLKIEKEGAFVAPYLDDPCQSIDDNGKFLILRKGNDGAVECSNTNGLSCDLSVGECSDCGETIYDEDYLYLSENGDYYCEPCYNDNFGTCDECGNETAKDDLRQTANAMICKDCLGKPAEECDHGIWRNTENNPICMCSHCCNTREKDEWENMGPGKPDMIVMHRYSMSENHYKPVSPEAIKWFSNRYWLFNGAWYRFGGQVRFPDFIIIEETP